VAEVQQTVQVLQITGEYQVALVAQLHQKVTQVQAQAVVAILVMLQLQEVLEAMVFLAVAVGKTLPQQAVQLAVRVVQA
jgi:hypothetical protein